jgi:hypothetical protein
MRLGVKCTMLLNRAIEPLFRGRDSQALCPGARLYIRLNHVNLFPIRRAVPALKESINSDSLSKPATR